MKKVILTKGLSGSGKSTWAKQMVDDNPGQYKRVNKDLLRFMMDNSKHTSGNEKFVMQIRDDIILQALKAGKSVIVDDTNLESIHEKRIRELVKGLAEIEIKDFTDVPIDVCIERDLKRLDSVGERVIRGQYNKYLAPKVEQIKRIEYIKGLPEIVCADLDGTLSLFDRTKKNPYNRDFEHDELNQAVASIISHETVVLLSGRDEKFRKQTQEFLDKNNIFYLSLFMRKSGDKRSDVLVKQEIFDNEIRGKYNVKWIADDRQKIVDMWRSMGLTCFQVAPGDF
jgi:predicted kinase